MQSGSVNCRRMTAGSRPATAFALALALALVVALAVQASHVANQRAPDL